MEAGVSLIHGILGIHAGVSERKSSRAHTRHRDVNSDEWQGTWARLASQAAE